MTRDPIHDLLVQLRPALVAELMQMIPMIGPSDLTTNEVIAWAGLLRPIYTRVLSGDQSAAVLKLVPRADT